MNAISRMANSTEGILIDRFQKPRPQLAVHIYRRGDNSVCDFRISQSFSCVPAFLIHLDCSRSAGFFPARIMCHWGGGNLFFFDQFLWRVFWWERRRHRLSSTRGKFFRKFLNEALRWPGAGFAERADGPASDVIADCFQSFWIFGHATAAEHSVGDLLHPKRTFPARRALATALVGIKLVDVVERPNHIARVIQHDDAAGSSH